MSCRPQCWNAGPPSGQRIYPHATSAGTQPREALAVTDAEGPQPPPLQGLGAQPGGQTAQAQTFSHKTGSAGRWTDCSPWPRDDDRSAACPDGAYAAHSAGASSPEAVGGSETLTGPLAPGSPSGLPAAVLAPHIPSADRTPERRWRAQEPWCSGPNVLQGHPRVGVRRGAPEVGSVLL